MRASEVERLYREDNDYGVQSQHGNLKSSHRKAMRRKMHKKNRKDFLKNLNRGWADAF